MLIKLTAILIKNKITQEQKLWEETAEKEKYDVFGCLWKTIFQFKWSVGLEPRNN